MHENVQGIQLTNLNHILITEIIYIYIYIYKPRTRHAKPARPVNLKESQDYTL